MEEENKHPTQQAEQNSNKLTFFVANKKYLIPGGILIFLLLFIPIFILLLSNSNAKKAGQVTITPTPAEQADQVKKAAQPTKTPDKQPSQTLVYGTWTSLSSVIRAIDIQSDHATTLATLPLTVKKVTVLSNSKLLYIDQTDTNDHGQRISVYDIKQKQIVTNIPADSGYGIDDYILSPNKRYLAIWEVQFNPQTQTLQGGKSRVYSVDLTQPTITNLLYDESTTPTIPIHYPRAILNDGTVLTDQFIPNDPKGGAGWAYGMSVVDFDGTNKQDIASMPNGTYGSQPSLSPDGKYVLFAGYDGSNGDGTAVKNGYRQALLTPDTVELLNTQTMQRFKLPNLPTTNTYSNVQWDKETGNVIISILSPDSKQMGIFSYDLGKLQMTQIPLPTANSTPYGYISQLTNTKTLIGIQSTDAANLGNLGETYAYAYTQMAILEDNKLSYLSLEDPFAQYITILPSNYFKNVLGAETQASSSSQPQITYAYLQGTNANPQNFNFFLKTTLGTIRLQGKSTPLGTTDTLSCINLGKAQCSALGLTPNASSYTLCQNTQRADNRTANACY